MFDVRVQVERVRVRVRVRTNYVRVRTPVRVERVFVFGERCSGTALVFTHSEDSYPLLNYFCP